MKIKILLIMLLFAGIVVLTVKLKGSPGTENESVVITENESVTIIEKYSIKEAYQYPAVPGTKEWESLGSTQKRKESCMVSKDILSNMTTDALIETIVTYPFFTDVNAFETLDMGLEALRAEFGGVDELLTRTDAYERTIAFIENICPEYLNVKSEEDWDNLMNNFDKKNKTKFDILHLINAGTLLKILSENGKVTMRSGVYTTTDIRTPNESYVGATKGYTWLDHGVYSGQAEVINDNFCSVYDTAISIDPISPSYNCHSYAWYSQSTSNEYWISGDDIYPYLEDGSYSPVLTPSLALKVVYRNANGFAGHSARYSYYNTFIQKSFVVSKWGYYGVFYHELTDCPYYNTNPNITYWN